MISSVHIQDVSDTLLQWAHPNRAPSPENVHLPLMSLHEALACVVAYWLLVLVSCVVVQQFGAFHRSVKILQILYNLGQVVLCGYMCYWAVVTAVREDYLLVCNGSRHYESPKYMATLTWLFYVSKCFDFLDTIFIVLRAKWQQLTFLHLYHHTSIFLIYWMNARVCFAGDIYLTIVLNSFVHVVMYFYYFLCAVGYPPRWKQIVTVLQIVQFVLMIGQAVWMLAMGCAKPAENVIWLFLCYIVSLLVLFLHFYGRAYLGKGRGKGGKKDRSE